MGVYRLQSAMLNLQPLDVNTDQDLDSLREALRETASVYGGPNYNYCPVQFFARLSSDVGWERSVRNMRIGVPPTSVRPLVVRMMSSQNTFEALLPRDAPVSFKVTTEYKMIPRTTSARTSSKIGNSYGRVRLFAVLTPVEGGRKRLKIALFPPQ